MDEPSFGDLRERLERCSPDVQRSVRCMLALSTGDCVGLPFELWYGQRNRRAYDAAAAAAKPGLVLRKVLERVSAHHGPTARNYSDDTTCSDLKMTAVARFVALREAGEREKPSDLLNKCLYSEYITWRREAGGKLFQGTGGFTKGLLSEAAIQTVDRHGVANWPADGFMKHVQSHCSGGADSRAGLQKGLVGASWGNGAVMCHAPRTIASASLDRAVAAGVSESVAASLNSALGVLSNTHRHPTAVLAAELLDSTLAAVLRGEVGDADSLGSAVLRTEAWRKVADSVGGSRIHPIEQFRKFLDGGDCAEEEALAFVRAAAAHLPTHAAAANKARSMSDLCGVDPPAGARAPVLGRLLRAMSNWDDVHGSRDSPLLVAGSTTECVKFSQRGLNTVLIAIWCSAGARSSWDWMSRLLYVGGDADTVGAVAGQIAGPLLPNDDVAAAFQTFVGLGGQDGRCLCASVMQSAARRYFRRALEFCSGSWKDGSLLHSSLTDPAYACVEAGKNPRFTIKSNCDPVVGVVWLSAREAVRKVGWDVSVVPLQVPDPLETHSALLASATDRMVVVSDYALKGDDDFHRRVIAAARSSPAAPTVVVITPSVHAARALEKEFPHGAATSQGTDAALLSAVSRAAAWLCSRPSLDPLPHARF
eukprot:TRINITY_DN18296_c0_g1_i1.p1 TRINITY_DN18296_c0_g1~~TRINITY_DN18296_c0_g1_i1.p1  ORF type:complete len:650 (+),score=200.97 TRINITY_DN18296_c0_g1_i1:75-2024(+)